VLVLVMVTLAPGTAAPVGSDTVPRTDPVTVWATAAVPLKNRTRKQSHIAVHFLLIKPFLEKCVCYLQKLIELANNSISAIPISFAAIPVPENPMLSTRQHFQRRIYEFQSVTGQPIPFRSVFCCWKPHLMRLEWSDAALLSPSATAQIVSGRLVTQSGTSLRVLRNRNTGMTSCKRSQRKRQGKYLIIEQFFHAQAKEPD
jgi:hypothetical protein